MDKKIKRFKDGYPWLILHTVYIEEMENVSIIWMKPIDQEML